MDTTFATSCSTLRKPSAKALQLPELLEAIASFLQGSRTDVVNASFVCKAWSAVFTPYLWHTLDLPPIFRPDFILGLSQHGNGIRSLRVIGRFDLELVFKSCSQLQLLDLTLARSLDIISLKNMVECLPRLKILRLNCCYGQGLAWLSPLMELEFLQELSFNNGTPDCQEDDLSNPAVHELVQWGSVESMEEDSGISDGGGDVTGTEDEGTEVEYAFMPTQDAIDSDNEEVAFRPDHLGDFLAARASTLRRLSFEGSDLVGFNLFEALKNTGTMTELEARSATSTSALCTSCLPILALKYLNLAKTSIHRSRSVVEPLLRQCPELEVLDISWNFDPPWDEFQWSILHQYCLKLTSLNIGGLSSVDNDQLVRVVRLCPGLCSLIAPQSNLLNSVLDAIVDRCVTGLTGSEGGGTAQQPAPFLELDVSWCTGITQDAVESVLQHLATLKSIKFSWCQQIDLSVFRHRWSCLDLQELEAQGLDKPAACDPESKNTPEYTMFEQISRFRSLKRLVIGSDEVSVSLENGFGLLGSNGSGSMDNQVHMPLSRLEYLELVGSECTMREPELTVIVDSLPRLTHFHFGLGLVTPEMQAWLSNRRPDIHQDEQQIYY
ncbi:hypothetical protein BGX26_005334 [Mortierella sp. AD094]|nr:hypothetical protein BGX26_005334 [Mortierella sp. AD094]